MKTENQAGDNISPVIEDEPGPTRLYVTSTKVNFGRPSKSALLDEGRYDIIDRIIIQERIK